MFYNVVFVNVVFVRRGGRYSRFLNDPETAVTVPVSHLLNSASIPEPRILAIPGWELKISRFSPILSVFRVRETRHRRRDRVKRPFSCVTNFSHPDLEVKGKRPPVGHRVVPGNRVEPLMGGPIHGNMALE